MERQPIEPLGGERSDFYIARCPTRLVGAKDTLRSLQLEVVESTTRLILKNKSSIYPMSDRTSTNDRLTPHIMAIFRLKVVEDYESFRSEVIAGESGW